MKAWSLATLGKCVSAADRIKVLAHQAAYLNKVNIKLEIFHLQEESECAPLRSKQAQDRLRALHILA